MSNTNEATEKKVGLFDFVNDISTNKEYLFDDDTQSVYNIFMVNKALSQHIDTILLACEMNRRPALSKLMHHDFLFYSVDAKTRRGKWAKQQKHDEELIDYIKERYAVGNERALEFVDLLTDDQLEEIKLKLKTKKQQPRRK